MRLPPASRRHLPEVRTDSEFSKLAPLRIPEWSGQRDGLARDRVIAKLLNAEVSPTAVRRLIGATRGGVHQMAQRAKGA